MAIIKISENQVWFGEKGMILQSWKVSDTAAKHRREPGKEQGGLNTLSQTTLIKQEAGLLKCEIAATTTRSE